MGNLGLFGWEHECTWDPARHRMTQQAEQLVCLPYRSSPVSYRCSTRALRLKNFPSSDPQKKERGSNYPFPI